jgi:hypothetical protein
LRREIQSLSSAREQQGQRPGRGIQQGQSGQQGLTGQQGKAGTRAQAQGGVQQGGRAQAGGQQANGQGGYPTGQRGARGGDQQDGEGGDVGNGNPQGGEGGVVTYNMNTGNNKFDQSGGRANAPDNTLNPADSERIIHQGLQELNQLRQSAKNDPAALREIQDLVKEMQQLDPSRFPGNPEMVEQLHAQVLNDVDKLELEIRRNTDDPQVGQVRTSKAATVPLGYQDAVAEYYRQLSKGK